MESNLAYASKREYLYRVGQFYQFAPIKSDDELLDCPSGELQEILLNYTRFLMKKVASGNLSANTVPKMFRGIRWLLNSNYRENDIKWKPLEALFPKTVKRSGYKAWTTEQVKLMIDKTAELRNKALLHFQASTGARVGVHDHPLLMKHLTMMEWNGHGCYAVLLYADSDETTQEKDVRDQQDDVQGGDSYWSFLTPEATDSLDRYFDERKRQGECFTPDNPIFEKDLNRHVSTSVQLSGTNVTSIMFRIIAETPELNRNKKGSRHDVQVNHGFRKRMNTILKLESKINSNIAEKILGHKNGLDGVYLSPTRQQCFDEFTKAVTQLTVDASMRKQIEIDKEKKENGQLQAQLSEIDDLRRQVSSFENFKEELRNEFKEEIKNLIETSKKD